jgi:hypothetical protein
LAFLIDDTIIRKFILKYRFKLPETVVIPLAVITRESNGFVIQRPLVRSSGEENFLLDSIPNGIHISNIYFQSIFSVLSL